MWIQKFYFESGDPLFEAPFYDKDMKGKQGKSLGKRVLIVDSVEITYKPAAKILKAKMVARIGDTRRNGA